MNKQTLGIIAVAVIILIGAGLYINSNSKQNNQVASESSQTSEQSAQDQTNTPPEDKIMMAKDSTDNSSTDDKMMAKAGSYKDYSEEAVKSAQAEGQKVVLFFHAKWCPSCKAANIAFTENLEKIPSGVVVLKTDYDTNTELKTKYGITYQHTFVQIDNSGNQVSKWAGGDIDALVKNLK